MTRFRDRQGLEDPLDERPERWSLHGRATRVRAAWASTRRGQRSCRNGKFQLRLGILEESDHLITAHRGEILEKLIDRVSAFQTIDQIAHRTRVPANTGVPPRISRSLLTTLVMIRQYPRHPPPATPACLCLLTPGSPTSGCIRPTFLPSLPSAMGSVRHQREHPQRTTGTTLDLQRR